MTTALDQVVDHEGDMLAGEQSYLHLYETPQILAEQIAAVARLAIERARTIPNGPHHAMILAGVACVIGGLSYARRSMVGTKRS